jgi:hypothetical protein
VTNRPDAALAAERRRDAALLCVTIVVSGLLMLGGVTFALTANDGAGVPEADPVDSSAGLRTSITVEPATPAHHHRVSLPLRIAIPRLGVRGRILRRGPNGNRTLPAPGGFAGAGWWAGGSRPGDPGPAVVAGYVDSPAAPAVLSRLGSLRRGDVIRIGRRDGTVVAFAVQRLARYSNDRFPMRQVYGATRRPTLRLIAGSGSFDWSTGAYVDNTVVYATLVTRT